MLHPQDSAAAAEGGADRLYVSSGLESGDLSPEPGLVSSICREVDIPVRVMLRLNDGFTSTGGELARLVGLAGDYLSLGAEGMIFGFLDSDLEVDTEVCSYLAAELEGVPWTFHRAIDSVLSTDRAWRMLRRLPGLDAVISAGSVRGMAEGHDELTDRASADADVARLLMPGGDLQAEYVPWLVRAGVRQFHVGAEVRPGGSWAKAHVDPGYVRSWRLLLDDAVGNLARQAPA